VKASPAVLNTRQQTATLIVFVAVLTRARRRLLPLVLGYAVSTKLRHMICFDVWPFGIHSKPDVTVIDLDEEFIIDKDAEITSLMLSITADERIVYDPDGEFASFFAL